jgi:hypothetical protein
MDADAPRRLVTELRHRLDPDAIHPARLAGTDAWAAWGLTDHPDPQGSSSPSRPATPTAP